MLYQLQSNNESKTIILKLHANNLRDLRIIVYDKNLQENRYFDRIATVYGDRTIVINLPLSPKVAMVSIQDAQSPNRNTFTANSVKYTKLAIPLVNYDKKTRIFILSAFDVAKKIPTLSEGEYRSKNGYFDFHIYNVIRDHSTKAEIGTPARIHKELNFIEISRKEFLRLTIPERVLILLHEYSHNYLNRNMVNEHEADKNALKIFLDLKFPYIEGFTAFTDIFPDNEPSHSRLDDVEHYLIQRNNEEFNYGFY